YISVGDMEDVELFYYFIESQRDPSADPLMLWFTGGPGCSGFSALAYEIGQYHSFSSPFAGLSLSMDS
ncbi:hypothetical protein CRG98_049126, partial [Punica granatum]